MVIDAPSGHIASLIMGNKYSTTPMIRNTSTGSTFISNKYAASHAFRLALLPNPTSPHAVQAPAKTIIGSPVFQQDAEVTLNGNQCLYNAEGQAADLPMANEQYTIEFWMKSSGQGTSSGGFVLWGTCGAGLQVQAVRLNGWSGLRDYWWGLDYIGNCPALNDNAWHHISFTWDGSHKRMYLDFVELGSGLATSQGTNVNTKTTFCVGKTCGSEYFTGQMKGIRIYKYARVPTAATVHGGPTPPPPAPPPQTYLRIQSVGSHQRPTPPGIKTNTDLWVMKPGTGDTYMRGHLILGAGKFMSDVNNGDTALRGNFTVGGEGSSGPKVFNLSSIDATAFLRVQSGGMHDAVVNLESSSLADPMVRLEEG